MFDNLLNLVKEHASDAIIKNPSIPNEKNEEAISSTTNSIFNSLKSQVSSGNLNELLGMFSKGDTKSSPIVNAVSNNTITDLMSKFGLDKGAAGSIASQLIPNVMEKLVNKTNDKNDSSFDLNSIVSSLGGGDNSSLLNTLLK